MKYLHLLQNLLHLLASSSWWAVHNCTIALVHNCKCVKIFEIEIKKRESLKLSGATYIPYVWFDKKIIYNFNSFWFYKKRGNSKINLFKI